MWTRTCIERTVCWPMAYMALNLLGRKTAADRVL